MNKTANDNIALAKRALSHLDKKPSERKPGDLMAFFDSLADDVVFKSTVGEGTPLSGERHGKKAVISYFNDHHGIIEDHELLAPMEFVARGNRVVALGMESYRIVKSGVTVRNREVAVVYEFRDGLIARVVNIKDASELVLAYRSK